MIDELDIHVAPVPLGDGIRLYDAPGSGDEPTLAVNLRFGHFPEALINQLVDNHRAPG
jgi:hypothetical protein